MRPNFWDMGEGFSGVGRVWYDGGMDTADALIAAAKELSAEMNALRIEEPVAFTYNPFGLCLGRA